MLTDGLKANKKENVFFLILRITDKIFFFLCVNTIVRDDSNVGFSLFLISLFLRFGLVSIFLELPVPVVQGANLAGLQPPEKWR